MPGISDAGPSSRPLWWDLAGAPFAGDADLTETDVDVAVIGAGLSGLSAARTLAAAGRSVLVLDAGAPGHGASSRNGGMVGGGHRLSIDQLRARFGRDLAVRLLREAHLDSGSFVDDLIREHGIDCDYRRCGRFRGFDSGADYEAGARGLERLQRLIGVEAWMVSRREQVAEVATDFYAGGVVYPRHGGLNPAAWVRGIATLAGAAGARIVADTAVTAVDRLAAGWRVSTSRGALRCGEVLAATNGYTPAFLSQLAARIVPVPSFIIATEDLGAERVRELIPGGRVIVESRNRHCYYRASPDGRRIVFGARAAMFEVSPDRATRSLRRLLGQVFPQLGKVHITHSWRGRTGFSFNMLPHVGRIDGIWHAVAYSGSGNAMAPYLGHKAALAILGDPGAETAFSHTGLPRRWWYRGRPWFLPLADLALRIGDVVGDFRRRSSSG